MLINSFNYAAQSFLAGLEQIQQRSQRAQTELTTGLKINNVSDAPDQIANLWQTRSNLAQVQQVNANLNQVSTEVDTAQGVLQSAVTLVDRAETLGAQGSSRAHERIKTWLTNWARCCSSWSPPPTPRLGPLHLLSGNTDQQAPYSIDLTQASPISVYQGSAATRQALAPDGSQFSISLTAQQIFDSSNAQQNVFTCINNLRQALLNNDTAGATSALGDVQSANTYLNQQLAFDGTVQNRVTSSVDFGQNLPNGATNAVEPHSGRQRGPVHHRTDAGSDPTPSGARVARAHTQQEPVRLPRLSSAAAGP